MQRTAACMAVLVTLVASTPAWAQSDNKVAAEALFDQAQKLVEAGKYAEACAKFEQSQRLDPGIGTLLYLADCYEKSGRFASAWATFREGASQAHAAGQHDRATSGESRADALQPRLSKLTIKVSEPAQADSGLIVTRGDAQVPRSLYGVAVPVDGGQYEIHASAPGMKTWVGSVTVQNEGGNASIEVPTLEVDPNAQKSATPAPAPVAPPPPAPAPVTPPPPTRDSGADGSSQKALGVVFGGVGLVGIGVGTFFGLRAISKNSDAKSFCDGAACRDQRGVTLTDDAQSAATVSNVAFGVGLASLTAGIVLYATLPSAPERTARIRVTPAVAPGLASVTLGGRF
jgi:hypothetical protein